jgi:hypothetical protein
VPPGGPPLHDNEDFDLEKWRLPADFVPAAASSSPRSAPQPKLSKSPFTRMPNSWIDQLRGAGGAAWEVAALLWQREYKEHKLTVTLSNTEAFAFILAALQIAFTNE